MTKMKKSTQEETKIHNSRLVLSTIYNHGEISRVEISRLTELTRTTVSDVVNKFIAEGLVAETGVSPSRGGKRAILLSLVKELAPSDWDRPGRKRIPRRCSQSTR